MYSTDRQLSHTKSVHMPMLLAQPVLYIVQFARGHVRQNDLSVFWLQAAFPAHIKTETPSDDLMLMFHNNKGGGKNINATKWKADFET